jgi:hypothetical protein
MVGKMKPNTAVRLIGINETYNSYEEIKHFYDILDTKKGLTADGETVDKAQVTGTINIQSIAYADKVALENRYPEVTIKAAEIYCTVIFKNIPNVLEPEREEIFTRTVLAGTTITYDMIPTPSKIGTAQHGYTFTK